MPASVLSSAPRFPCAPNQQYVEQLGDYLTQSVRQGKLRMGVLTNGKHWVLGRPGAGEVRMTRPNASTLGSTLYEWLRDSALVSLNGMSPDREGIIGHFGPSSPSCLTTSHGRSYLHSEDRAGRQGNGSKETVSATLYPALVHEARHALGIGIGNDPVHSRGPSSVMSEDINQFNNCGPHPLDILAIYAM